MEICYRPIGLIHSPFTTRAGMPVQPAGAAGVRGRIEIEPQWAPGLQDLDGFSHLLLLYHFHQVSGVQLTVTPFLDTAPHGVWATRAPTRPNPIGLSLVRLLARQDCCLEIVDVDVLDGTPLLDLKPYVPEFDSRPEAQAGWLERVRGQVQTQRADDRFL